MNLILEAVDLVNRANEHENFYRRTVFPWLTKGTYLTDPQWEYIEDGNGNPLTDPEWDYHYDTKVALRDLARRLIER